MSLIHVHFTCFIFYCLHFASKMYQKQTKTHHYHFAKQNGGKGNKKKHKKFLFFKKYMCLKKINCFCYHWPSAIVSHFAMQNGLAQFLLCRKCCILRTFCYVKCTTTICRKPINLIFWQINLTNTKV